MKVNSYGSTPIRRFCEITSTGYDIQCGNNAKFFTTFSAEGTGGKSCCTQHLGKAVNAVLAAEPDGAAAKVVRL